ncbi:YceD family protein [Oceanobacillus halotolerans]|uniref:YceD family protein n=1 Tax=Oceanobacillus halotolerans TaxID=2663380 RepID=UPI0013D95EAA|nr:YceD family protein [Oceanobacillus halotolerans]
MKFTLSEIRKSAYNEPFTFENKVDVSELESMNNDIRQISSVMVDGNCSLHGEQITFSFQITGEMILPCARTLVDVPYPFHIQAREIFSTSPYYSKEEADNEIHPVEGDVIDLTPYIKENILLEVPFRVFSEDAKSPEETKRSGDGWEFTTENNQEKKTDPRLQKLEALLKDNKEEK